MGERDVAQWGTMAFADAKAIVAAGEVEAGALVEAGNAWETGDDRFYMTVGKTF